MPESDNTLHFTVDARLVAQLGTQLVPSDVMALGELVKNSYDADAEQVLVEYHEAPEGPFLVVEDDGNGMEFAEIRDGWMHIGTALKEREVTSPRYGRPRAGRIGIGRFAAQRLGRHLTLQTYPLGRPEALDLAFDWSRFVAGVGLDDVTHSVSRQAKAPDLHGTRLTIRQLEREWTLQDLKRILRDLVGLGLGSHGTATPERSDPGFQVVAGFHGETFTETLEELDLLREDRAMQIVGLVDAGGRGHYRFEFFKPEAPAVEDTYGALLRTGPLRFEADLFVFGGGEQMGTLGFRKAVILGREHGGVRLWLDGFRVKPYGDPSDDWLGLEAWAAARRVPLNMWRPQQILGEVHLSRGCNPGFAPLMTRRGLVENEAFGDLRHFLVTGLKRAAEEHAVIAGRITGRTRHPARPMEAVRAHAEAIRKAGSQAHRERLQALSGEAAAGNVDAEAVRRQKAQEDLLEKERRFADEALLRAVAQAEEDVIDFQRMLEVLASLGTGLATFAHEMRLFAQSVGIATQDLEAAAEDLGGAVASRLAGPLSELRMGLADMAAYREYIDEFVSARHRRRRESIELADHIEKLLGRLQPLLGRRKIRLTRDVRRGLRTAPMHWAQLSSMLFNLLTNAVKALEPPQVTDRLLLVQGRAVDDALSVLVADNGVGIAPAVRDRIFDPFVTRSHEPVDGREVLGGGTGLGLTIARRIAEEVGGSLDVCAAPPGYVTAFELRLPRKGETR